MISDKIKKMAEEVAGEYSYFIIDAIETIGNYCSNPNSTNWNSVVETVLFLKLFPPHPDQDQWNEFISVYTEWLQEEADNLDMKPLIEFAAENCEAIPDLYLITINIHHNVSCGDDDEGKERFTL